MEGRYFISPKKNTLTMETTKNKLAITPGMKTGVCANCGADYGLHNDETMQCPMNGREETRFDNFTGKYFPQKWQQTKFEDSGMKNFIEDCKAVANETGKTPRQLAEENKMLCDLLLRAEKFVGDTRALDDDGKSTGACELLKDIRKAKNNTLRKAQFETVQSYIHKKHKRK